MSKITSTINNYLSNRRLVKAQIKKQEMYIESVREEIKDRIQNPNHRFKIPYETDDEFFRRRMQNIEYHKRTIEKLKNGDISLCMELIEHEKQIEKQKEIKRQREASLSPEELKLYREGKLLISWKDDY